MAYQFVIDLVDEVTRPARQMADAMDHAVAPARRLQKEVAGIGGGVNNLDRISKRVGSALAGVFAVRSILNFGGAVVDTLSEFQKFDAVLTNTLGSKSEAQQTLQNISDFAARTPFQVNELTDSFVKLTNRGFKPTMAEMTLLGDLASSQGKDFNQLSEALLDAETGEFERLKELGITARSEGDRVKLSFKGVTQEIEKSPTAIRQALLEFGKMEGVAGSMDAISRTTGGMISNLQDQMTSFRLSIGEAFAPLLASVLPKLTTFFQSLSKWIKRNDALLKKIIGPIIGVTAAIAGLVAVGGTISLISSALGGLKIAFMGVGIAVRFAMGPLGIILTVITVLTAAVIWAMKKWDGFRGAMYGIWGVFKETGKLIHEMLVLPLMAFGKIVISAFTFDPALFKSGLEDAVNFAQNTILGSTSRMANAYVQGNETGKKVGKSLGTQNDVDQMMTVSGFNKKTPWLLNNNFPELINKDPTKPKDPTKNPLDDKFAGINGKVEGGIKHITINIENLVRALTVQATTLGMSESQVRGEVSRVLLSAVNEVNYQ